MNDVYRDGREEEERDRDGVSQRFSRRGGGPFAFIPLTHDLRGEKNWVVDFDTAMTQERHTSSRSVRELIGLPT